MLSTPQTGYATMKPEQCQPAASRPLAEVANGERARVVRIDGGRHLIQRLMSQEKISPATSATSTAHSRGCAISSFTPRNRRGDTCTTRIGARSEDPGGGRNGVMV